MTPGAKQRLQLGLIADFSKRDGFGQTGRLGTIARSLFATL
jgi:hypothetical protein